MADDLSMDVRMVFGSLAVVFLVGGALLGIHGADTYNDLEMAMGAILVLGGIPWAMVRGYNAGEEIERKSAQRVAEWATVREQGERLERPEPPSAIDEARHAVLALLGSSSIDKGSDTVKSSAAPTVPTPPPADVGVAHEPRATGRAATDSHTSEDGGSLDPEEWLAKLGAGAYGRAEASDS